MIGVGEQRRFSKQFTSMCCVKNDRVAVNRVPDQTQPALLNLKDC
jgi:hypothetical protein